MEAYVNEREAIARLKQGDINGLAALVNRYQVQAVRAAYLIIQDRAAAEDVVQSAFIRAYQRINQYDEHRPFAPWFMRSVVNAAVQFSQKQSWQLSLDDAAGTDMTFADLLPDPNPGPQDRAEAGELQAVIWDALYQLSAEQRAAVVMRYYLDMTEREMADELETAPGTIKWRLHSARKQLRGLLARIWKPSQGWEA